MGIVVLGAVFVDIKGYPTSTYIPGGRNVGRVEQVPGGVSRNVVEDIANVELRPTFVSLVDDTGLGADVVRQLKITRSTPIMSCPPLMAWAPGWRCSTTRGMCAPPSASARTCGP